MNKVSKYLLTFLMCFIGLATAYAQNDKTQARDNKESESNIFLHTIERGQTVYSIATMKNKRPIPKMIKKTNSTARNVDTS